MIKFNMNMQMDGRKLESDELNEGLLLEHQMWNEPDQSSNTNGTLFFRYWFAGKTLLVGLVSLTPTKQIHSPIKHD